MMAYFLYEALLICCSNTVQHRGWDQSYYLVSQQYYIVILQDPSSIIRDQPGKLVR